MAGVTTFWAPCNRPLARTAIGGSGIPLNAAPSIDFLATGIQDHRYPYNSGGSSATAPTIVAWYGGAEPMVANYVPSAIATANIAALANVTNGTAMTLVSSSGAGITVVTPAAPAVFYANRITVTAGCAIDGLPSYQLFGTGGNSTTGFYNRATCVGRCVSVTGSASATGGNFLISGWDIYGFPMTQLLTAAAGATTANTTKAFKVIKSVVPQFTDAHNYSVGTADVYGFGILASFWGDVAVVWNNQNITANTGFTAAVTTSPATNLTGDVRGTYAVQSASDGTKRLQIFVVPSLPSITTNATTGLFGVLQA